MNKIILPSLAATFAFVIIGGCTNLKITTAPPPSTDWTAETEESAVTNSQTDEPYVNIYMVALDDNGKSGKLIGCGDSIVGVKVKYGLTRDKNTALDTLKKLFAVKQQYYGESGLYNSLYQSDLNIEDLSVDKNKTATLKLSGKYVTGGTCDTPRFKEQIRETLLQFNNLFSDVKIYLNNELL